MRSKANIQYECSVVEDDASNRLDSVWKEFQLFKERMCIYGRERCTRDMRGGLEEGGSSLVRKENYISLLFFGAAQHQRAAAAIEVTVTYRI